MISLVEIPPGDGVSLCDETGELGGVVLRPGHKANDRLEVARLEERVSDLTLL